ncbi:MAG: phosphoribosylglycinamide formyltransferase [Chitinophagales bacterium]
MKNIAIFASGKGSNAQAIINYFSNHPGIRVSLVVTNNPAAGVIKVAHDAKIVSAIVTKESLQKEELIIKLLEAAKVEFIALAGFLQMVPAFLLKKYPNRIVNIHPALLPKHGGKGMYGQKVHEAVLAAGDTETGISIHYVNERYDEGETILQKKISVELGDTAEIIAAKVHALEHEWYPKTIEQIL